MNILDYILLGIIILAALMGFKKGFITSIVAFVGTLLVIILAFYLKNPISSILYNVMPFSDLGGKLEGLTIFNILIYEGASYLITLVVLSFIMGIIVKISGIFNKLVHATLILTLPSKLLGALVGLIEGVIISFIIVFIISLISSGSLYSNSKYGNMLLSNTPVLSNITKNTYNSVTEIYDICKSYEKATDKSAANLESLDVLLKYEILSASSAEKLIDSGKIKIAGASNVVNKYKLVS